MGTMKMILVTGFEPFAGESINSSQEVVRRLQGAVIARHRVVVAMLPCVFAKVNRELGRLYRLHRPFLVICIGQANGRKAIAVERVAINVNDAQIADNAGARPVDRPVVRGGPAAYFSTLPVKAIVEALRAKGIPAEVSQTAGTFVCNHVFYGLMHRLGRQPGIRGGFIHVPILSEQATSGQPSMLLETIVLAVRIALATALRCKRDVRVEGGANHSDSEQ